MKYILLSILIIPFVSVMILFSLSNPVFGKTPQFYSVGECLMRTMKNRNLTGNKKFDVVYKECEKIIKPLDLSNENIEWIPISLQKETLKKLWILKAYLQVQKKTSMFVDEKMT